MVDSGGWRGLAGRLRDLLGLERVPVAVSFRMAPAEGLPRYEGSVPAPDADGRSGPVAAGCVFWRAAAAASFVTVPADHGNCSLGSLTHGFARLEDIAEKNDVAALLDGGWLTRVEIAELPRVRHRYEYVAYGPLGDEAIEPDVVLVWLTAAQLMILHDAIPGLRIEGKPQCHIVAVAKEKNEVAVSFGCTLGRFRSDLPASELVAALPAGRLAEIVERVRMARDADEAALAFARRDGRRFGRGGRAPSADSTKRKGGRR